MVSSLEHFRAESAFLLFIFILRCVFATESNTQHIDATARYVVSSWRSSISPLATLLELKPVENCNLIRDHLSRQRSISRSPQLEFAHLLRGVKKSLAHKFFKSRTVVKRIRVDEEFNKTLHVFVRSLVAVQTVLKATCEGMQTRCTIPAKSQAQVPRFAKLQNEQNDLSDEAPDREFDEHEHSESDYETNDHSDREAHEAEQDGDSAEGSGIRLAMVAIPGHSRKQIVAMRGSFERQLGNVRCFVLELEAQLKLASLTAGEKAVAIGQTSWLMSCMTLLLAIGAVIRVNE